jgi:pantoate--beta-alanine ligase
MERFDSIDAQRSWSRAQRRKGLRIAFVPTMGALHEGHLSLVRRAKERADLVVVSIYLNPTQFDNPADLEQYPSSLADDLILCSAAGVDAVFCPDTATMYPESFSTFAEVHGPINDCLCAVTRPGHFRGVTTVVLKLFNIVEPDVAVFGEKDLQQVLIVSRLIADLALPVELEVAPCVREPDGLAMSSRNRRLSPEDRITATSLPRGLERAAEAFAAGRRNANDLMTLVAEEVLSNPGVDLDYCELIDPHGFTLVEDDAELGHILAVAAFVGGVRLIDHLVLGLQRIPVDLEA